MSAEQTMTPENATMFQAQELEDGPVSPSKGLSSSSAQAPQSNKNSFSARAVGFLMATFLRMLAVTWRTRIEGLEDIEQLFRRRGKAIFALWHGKYLALLPLLRNHPVCVFTSVSPRGDVIANICRHFGYHCEQIPDRGGDYSLEIMRKALIRYGAGVVAVDGPMGPYHSLKPGVIQLASELSYPIIPMSVASKRKRIFHDRWDRMERPRFFTKVSVIIGRAISIPPTLRSDQVKIWSSKLRSHLEAADHRAEVSALS